MQTKSIRNISIRQKTVMRKQHYVVVVVDLYVFRNGSSTLHDPDRFIIVSATGKSVILVDGKSGGILMTNLHFSPFTPHFSKIFDGFEVHFSALL